MLGKNFSGVLAFMKVASLHSFSEAAKELQVAVPSISKSIARLESQLNVRLLERSTHHVSLTREGAFFFERCLASVENLVKTAHEVKGLSLARTGTVRVSATVGFGRKCIAPLLPAFLERYPDIRVELELSDKVVDLIDDNIDIVVRNARVLDDGLIARPLAPMHMKVCASPAYLKKAGQPLTVDDLRRHSLIGYRRGSTGQIYPWEFQLDGERISYPMPDVLLFDDPSVVAMAALSGSGIAQLASYQVDEHLQSGLLVQLLGDTVAQGRFHYLCYKGRSKMPMRTRLLIDYLMESFDVGLP